MFEFLEEMDQLDELRSLPRSPGRIAMKYLDEYRDGRGRAEAGRGHRADRHPPLDDHGGLRRTDAHASSSTGSTSSCLRRSNWSTAPAARSA